MKQLILFLSIIVTVSVLTSFIRPKGNKEQEPKIYSMKLKQSEWSSRLMWLENAKEIMRKSNLPGNVISQWQDSLSLFQQEISEQIGSQIKADTSKPKKQ